MPDETLLVLSGPGLSPYSARGLTMTLELIDGAKKIERDVNGVPVDLSIPEMRKYRSKVTCTDVNAPAFSGVWPGQVLTVDCPFEFSYLTASPAYKERISVPGTDRVDGDYTFYRPQLTMVVMDFNNSFEEWPHNNGWEMDLEEE